MKKLILIAVVAAVSGMMSGGMKAQDVVRQLESPYYVFPRSGVRHVDLSADWQLASEDNPVADIKELDDNDWIKVSYPTSVQMANFKAGKLGDPYAHLNARDHEKLEQKVWYYRKNFTIPEQAGGDNILLNFDGIDYFAKVWLNGVLLGTHRGIFGGPSVDISKTVKYGAGNELLVEVLSANYGNPGFIWNKPGEIVKGWFLTGGSAMEPYFNLGLWRGVRIEIVPSYHLERPFLYTRSVENGRAVLGFEAEIFSGKNSGDYTLHPWKGAQLDNNRKNAPVKDRLTVLLELTGKDGAKALVKEFSPYVIEGRCFMEETVEFDRPKLWYPNGLGNPDYYLAEITLKVNGKAVDRISFDFGVRKIEHLRTAGIRTADRWQNWQFVVNGKKIFVKGINWMPVDALYDLTADKYDWAVRMAKNAGIQMFRIWGSGLHESNEFYDACNKYGIMVWQDFNIANFDTPEWPQEVWEAQVCRTIFRLRNQPSLVVWCGGNEFNPYSYGNAASVGILERSLAIFDPTRFFVRTSPDNGSLHTYPDWDPAWYKSYDLVPYISETGIHSITDAGNIREVVKAGELADLSGMYEKDFAAGHPEFVQHFAEYHPSRVPRMLSRASHIDNMAKPAIEAIAEATQIGAGEFYQVMSEVVQSNYPVTAGLMPWVYKRPWPVVAAIHLVDGFGQPSAPYYFLKRTYAPTRITVDVKRLLWAPGEIFPVGIKVLNGVNQPAIDGKVEVRLLDDRFNELWKQEHTLRIAEGTSVSGVHLGEFKIPDNYREKFFFAIATLYDGTGREISRAEYWPRTIKQMEDPDFYGKFSTKPTDWPALANGPWLKPTVAKRKTSLEISGIQVHEIRDNLVSISFTVGNKGKYPSPMTYFDLEPVKSLFFASDNYFWLAPGESKEITMEINLREDPAQGNFNLLLVSWNAGKVVKNVKIRK
ncbi:MAG: hypothetical protein LBS79_06995 [Tannerella sp.]|nr:hypothetical protein [Tannerella sp.]